VEGRSRIERIVTGVTASQALIDAAIARDADALLVHHGFFWRGEDGRITGIRRKRIGALLGGEVSLLAYHLPLDAHPEFGNNAQLAARCGWQADGRFGDQDVGWLGEVAPCRLDAFAAAMAAVLGRLPQVIGDPARPVRRIAWCSGGAQAYFEAAIALGVDAFVSGEISEPTVHLARETGVAYLAAGHHATERYGVEALGRHLAGKFALDVEFVDIDNPV
jgi:dinuclear metal center YbgI/SA1388 family protein